MSDCCILIGHSNNKDSMRWDNSRTKTKLSTITDQIGGRTHFVQLLFFIGHFVPTSTSLHYIFRGRNVQISNGTRQEKGRVECLWEFQIFYQGITVQIFGKTICYFKSPISPWKGPQSKSLFWAFFLNSLWSPSTKKNQLWLSPPSCFSKRYA